MADSTDLVYCMGEQAWEEPEQDIIWAPLPAVVSLCSALGVHKCFYHREKQYGLGFGLSFPRVSNQCNGSGTLLELILYLSQTTGLNNFFLNNTTIEIAGVGLQSCIYFYDGLIMHLFKNIFHLGLSQMFWFTINICFENIIRVVSLMIQENE